MDLNQLFANQRTGNDPNTKVSRNDFQRDYDRIIFSSAFRRLQNKTQVFPLPGSVFVHNRLTHSLEVSSVGRSLGSLAGAFLVETYKNDLSETAKHFYTYQLGEVIAAACLCHDIGNPAFGHSGEDAIASYFARNESELKPKFAPNEWADFINFEGNANAIRVLTNKQVGKEKGGIQLTHTTLASIAKYPCEAIAKDKSVLHRKKFGFFQSEKETFKHIAENTAMIQETQNPLGYKRHPFVWLVEAADDICYNIIDMEDAHRLGIVNTSDCKNLFYDLIKSIEIDTKKIDQKLSVITDSNEQISYLRAKVINSLINKSIEIFKDNAIDLLEGNFASSLLGIYQKENNALQKIERFSIEKIYNHKAVVEIENAGYNVMYELLNHFIPSAILDPSERKGYDKKALQLIPNQFRVEEGTVYQKVLGVLDFVSGMTDNYATDLYRKIKGIDIGMTM
ncbi:deoxyguanosinetriphosphate triphosphohydrolase [Riemerella anatipestifer]|uniref:deoxyguanosinetriphosphate triphosphohydrolase n=1 Tax=Riemerella anatipestifer TaxID=34085 RepID=UPI00137252AC|nr:deoxyguanosinetriphosphate triphosphohydrolase [Riemerella anatipestifer]MBT0550038.1 deoxyguanosinetriphosphate triphosphohydrolase [Riemerella anatipestifer]MBT0556876.1 deoxyguanosinetriphosphate triphosphohydrolase [Riemerella anatipestifer]MBT0560803.1 deoxyguanosinetriphosphate triphosphohydrolase [Riemerella anatipestifer]NAV17161.1 deoxyguanosinetriphosphate triphosphohydrolase [Riemerella anatipestifer]UZX27619.1 deoxyguanosinetriphosphate triphosphohydrolase [Riemerella anatipesti